MRVYSATDGTPRTPPLKHPSVVSVAGFSPDGAQLLTVCADGAARAWDVTGPGRSEPAWTRGDKVLHAAFSPGGDTVATGESDHRAHLLSARDGAELRPPLQHPGEVIHVAFDRDGGLVTVCPLPTREADLLAQAWDREGRPVASGSPHARAEVSDTQATLSASALSADGTRLLTVTQSPYRRGHVTARVWAVDPGAPVGDAVTLDVDRFEDPAPAAGPRPTPGVGGVDCFAAAVAGEAGAFRVVTVAYDADFHRARARFHDPVRGTPPVELSRLEVNRPFQRPPVWLRFSPDGRLLALVAGVTGRFEPVNPTVPKGRVTVWDTVTGKELFEIDPTGFVGAEAEFDPRTLRLLIWGDTVAGAGRDRPGRVARAGRRRADRPRGGTRPVGALGDAADPDPGGRIPAHARARARAGPRGPGRVGRRRPGVAGGPAGHDVRGPPVVRPRLRRPRSRDRLRRRRAVVPARRRGTGGPLVRARQPDHSRGRARRRPVRRHGRHRRPRPRVGRGGRPRGSPPGADAAVGRGVAGRRLDRRAGRGGTVPAVAPGWSCRRRETSPADVPRAHPGAAVAGRGEPRRFLRPARRPVRHGAHLGRALAEPAGPVLRHAGPVTWAAFLGDGPRVVTGGGDGLARAWDVSPASTALSPLGPTPSSRPGATGSPPAPRRTRSTARSRRSRSTCGATTARWRSSGAMAEVMASTAVDGASFATPGGDRLVREWTALQHDNAAEFRSSPGVDDRWHNARAADAEQAGQWAAAAGHLDPLVVAHPDDWSFHARRGRARAERDDRAGAMANYTEARRLSPGPALEWLEREASEAEAVGATTPALMALDQLVAARPDDPGPLDPRTAPRGAAGQWNDAIADLTAAGARGERPFAAACDLAAARLMAGDAKAPDNIRALAGRAATGADDQAVARLLLIRPDPGRDTLELARQLARKALAAAPDDPKALATLALVEIRSGNAMAARDACNRVNQLPNKPGLRGSRQPPFAHPLRAWCSSRPARSTTPATPWNTRRSSCPGPPTPASPSSPTRPSPASSSRRPARPSPSGRPPTEHPPSLFSTV